MNTAVERAKEMEKVVEAALKKDWEGRKAGVEVL
jgi:hypothetical protein